MPTVPPDHYGVVLDGRFGTPILASSGTLLQAAVVRDWRARAYRRWVARHPRKSINYRQAIKQYAKLYGMPESPADKPNEERLRRQRERDATRTVLRRRKRMKESA